MTRLRGKSLMGTTKGNSGGQARVWKVGPLFGVLQLCLGHETDVGPSEEYSRIY